MPPAIRGITTGWARWNEGVAAVRSIAITDELRRWLIRLGGVVLLVAGVVLLATTERAMVGYRAALHQHGGAVVDLGHAQDARSGLDGRMVRIVGTPRVVELAYDADFNQQVATPVLTRHVAMFQWRELRLGNRASYELDWADTPQDSSRFQQPAGHHNPGAFPIAHARFFAGKVMLGPYVLDAGLVNALPGSAPVPVDARRLPENLAATFVAHAGALVTSSHPGAPGLGDLRVSWTAVPAQEVSVLGRVEGDRLVAVPNAANGPGYEVNVGDSTLLAMRPDLAAAPSSPWLRRVLALLLAVAGVAMIGWRDGVRPDGRLAAGGGLLAGGAVGAWPWLGASLGAALAWLALAVVGAALLGWWWRARGAG